MESVLITIMEHTVNGFRDSPNGECHGLMINETGLLILVIRITITQAHYIKWKEKNSIHYVNMVYVMLVV